MSGMGSAVRRWRVFCAIAVISNVGAAPAWAQASGPKSAPATAPADRKVDEARSHYERGLKLYDEGAYDGARVEFEKAYELAPSYKILYNIGLVRKQLADYVGGMRNFELYLSEGGANVPEARRAEVAREMNELRGRIGSVTVTANVPDAEVFVDDVSVGRLPLAKPVLVNPGRRKISATRAGRIPATRVVEVAGSVSIPVKLELQESRTVVMVEKTQRRVPWVGWGATAALAIGAGATGYFALKTESDLDDAKAKPNADPDDLDSKKSTARTLSVVSDVCTVAAVVTGGISLYYTIKWGKDAERANQAPPPSSLSFGLRPGGLALTGKF